MNRYLISQFKSIREALITLNQITSDNQSLLVIDNNQRLVGTLTDGDIRRGLISGANLNDAVHNIMHKNFKYILKSEFDINQLKALRDKHIYFVPVLDEDHHIVDVINLKCYKSYLPIDAVLMAGGKGERLRPLTELTPKPLLPVGNKAIIDHNIERLISFGIKHISVTVNYLKEQIEQHFSEPIYGVLVKCVEEPQFLGTIGSIKFVENFQNDTILVMNSDIFTNINYEDFYLHFMKNNADMSVAAVPYTVSVPYGIFDLDGRNIIGLQEKPTYNYYANAGIYLIKRSVLESIPDNSYFDATDLISKLIGMGKTVVRFPLDGVWIDIGNRQEYEKANDLVKNRFRFE